MMTTSREGGAVEEKGIIFGVRISSVGPGVISGQDATHEPSNMDLAMKLHYLRAVYYFQAGSGSGPGPIINVQQLKAHTFHWLQHFYTACGRLRRADPSARPYIKCNDCGVRFLEAQSSETLHDWLLQMGHDHHQRLLVPNQVIGPDLQFSPLVFLQVTKFRCGGLSVGLSWAHLLGDVFSMATFMNALGSLSSGHPLPPSFFQHPRTHIHKTGLSQSPTTADPVSIKRVGPVGDHWAVVAQKHKMELFSFRLTDTQISHLRFKLNGGQNESELVPSFGLLCAVIWKSVAQVKNGPEPNAVTVCRRAHDSNDTTLCNGQSVFVVEAQFKVSKADPWDLAALINGASGDERSEIEDAMEREGGVSDFVVYGANLTFVDMEEADLYGFQLQGLKPTYVSCFLDSIGDEEGVVFVLPAPNNDGNVLTFMMPDSYADHLKCLLKTHQLFA